MMPKFARFALLALGGALLTFGCYTEHHARYEPGPAVVGSYAYVYYPDAEVYYAPEHHVYYWSDGGTWRSGPRVPPNVVLHEHVTVKLDSAEPYQRHAQVQKQYPPHQQQKQKHESSNQDHDQH